MSLSVDLSLISYNSKEKPLFAINHLAVENEKEKRRLTDPV